MLNNSNNNSIPNLQTDMSTMFVDLEKEVSDRAQKEFATVIVRMLDLYEERIKRIMEMNSGDNAALEELRRSYVIIKLHIHRLRRRYDNLDCKVNDDPVLNQRISDLEIQTMKARRKFYEFKRSIDPHPSECECRGCRFLGQKPRNGARRADSNSNE